MSQFQQWIKGIPLSIPPKVDSMPGGTLAVPKGTPVVQVGAILVKATNANSTKLTVFVTTKTFLAGAAGRPMDVVGLGQRVTVETTSILNPGASVVVDGTTGNIKALTTEDSALKIGTYIGIEGGVYEKDTSGGLAEGFLLNSGPEVPAAVGAIVAIQLGR